MDIVVQPSVPWMNMNDSIKGSGLFFPVDPGPSVSPPELSFRNSLKQFQAKIGGMVGTNCR
jgi:D-lactate dehydrogenase (cytochrome)